MNVNWHTKYEDETVYLLGATIEATVSDMITLVDALRTYQKYTPNEVNKKSAEELYDKMTTMGMEW